MLVVFVLFLSWAIFRWAGSLGATRINTWQKALPYALAVMFLFTATAHFNSIRHDMVRMIPGWVPYPTAVVYLTGVLEILGAIGLMTTRYRRAAGICLTLFLIAVFPANVKAATEGVLINNAPATPLWLRAPMQLMFIGLVWWGAVAKRGEEIHGSHSSQNQA